MGVELDVRRDCYYHNSTLLNQDVGKPVILPSKSARVTLLGSGAMFTEVIKAAKLLADEGIGADVFSVTSWRVTAWPLSGKRCRW